MKRVALLSSVAHTFLLSVAPKCNIVALLFGSDCDLKVKRKLPSAQSGGVWGNLSHNSLSYGQFIKQDTDSNHHWPLYNKCY